MNNEQQSSQETSSELSSPLSVPVAIIIAGLIIAGAVMYTGSNRAGVPSDGSGNTPTAQQPSGPDAEEVRQALADSGSSHVLGNADAPITFVEFGDFECPFCARFHSDARKQIIEEYVDTGKVKMVWKHFPLSAIHPSAEAASVASECAGDQEMFWEYHDAIFEYDGTLNEQAINDVARNIGLDMTAFQSCRDAGTYEQKVSDEFNLGRSLNVSGTPTFFINGERVVGAVPFSSIKPIIENALVEVEE